MQKLAGIEALFMLIDIYILIKGVFSGRLRTGVLRVILPVLFLASGLFAFLYHESTLTQLAVMLCASWCILLPIVLIRDMKLWDIIFVSVIVVGIVTGIVMLVVRSAEILGINKTGLYIIDILANFTALGLCILISKRVLLRHMTYSLLLMSGRIKRILVATIWIGVMLTYSFSFFLTAVPSSLPFVSLTLLALVLVTISGIICPLLVADNISKNNYKSALESTRRQMSNQVKCYESVIANDIEFKKFKHDYKNLFIGLRAYLSSNDNIGALQYLSQLYKPLENNYLSYCTGDIILDALLADKRALADKINTTIEYDGMLPNCLLSSEDTCLIFGNAIDNALDACAKLPNDEVKTINVSCVYSAGYLFIRITNPVINDAEIFGNSIKTTKTDAGFHGIGLLSMQNAIKKYSGIMSLSCKNKLFSFEADLDFNELAMSV